MRRILILMLLSFFFFLLREVPYFDVILTFEINFCVYFYIADNVLYKSGGPDIMI